MGKNKILFLIILAVIVVALGGSAVMFFYFKKDAPDQADVNKQGESEEQSIKQANQKALQLAQANTIKPVRPIDETDHYWGDIKASVQLIMYQDFSCSFCADFSQTVEQIKDEFADDIVIAFRHFPLRSNAMAMPAAEASECAAEQGIFWQMHDKLFIDNVKKLMNNEQFIQYASELGLEMDKFSQCLERGKYKDKIIEQIAEAKGAGVSGAPASFVNEEILPGAYPFEDFTRSDGSSEEGMRSVIRRHIGDRK